MARRGNGGDRVVESGCVRAFPTHGCVLPRCVRAAVAIFTLPCTWWRDWAHGLEGPDTSLWTQQGQPNQTGRLTHPQAE